MYSKYHKEYKEYKKKYLYLKAIQSGGADTLAHSLRSVFDTINSIFIPENSYMFRSIGYFNNHDERKKLSIAVMDSLKSEAYNYSRDPSYNAYMSLIDSCIQSIQKIFRCLQSRFSKNQVLNTINTYSNMRYTSRTQIMIKHLEYIAYLFPSIDEFIAFNCSYIPIATPVSSIPIATPVSTITPYSPISSTISSFSSPFSTISFASQSSPKISITDDSDSDSDSSSESEQRRRRRRKLKKQSKKKKSKKSKKTKKKSKKTKKTKKTKKKGKKAKKSKKGKKSKNF